MKHIFKILVLLLVFSCSRESIADDDCRCVKTTYKYETIVSTGFDGLPVLNFVQTVLSEENVNCNDEVNEVDNGDGTFYDIRCE